MVDIKMQIVVGKELEGDDFVPIRVQRKNAVADDAAKFLHIMGAIRDIHYRGLADAILHISVLENKHLYREIGKESAEMYEGIRELFKDELDAATANGYNSGSRIGAEEARLTIVRNMIGRGYDDEEIAAIVSLPLAVIEEERNKM